MTGITFQAILNRVTTTVDGGWRVTFDVSENEGDQVVQLAKRRDETLQVAVITSSDIVDAYTPEKRRKTGG